MFPLLAAVQLVVVYRKLRYLGVVILVLTALATTLSRTGLMMAVLSLFVVYLCWNIKAGRYLRSGMFVAVTLLGATYLIVGEIDSNFALVRRFATSEFDLASVNSISVRVERWAELLQWLGQHPEALVFGVGPQKAAVESVFIDSQYFGLLKKTGLMGLFLVLLIECYVLFMSFKLFLSARNKEIVCISLLVVGLMFSLLLAQLTVELINDTQAIGLLLAVLGFYSSKTKLCFIRSEQFAEPAANAGIDNERSESKS
jgi:hypothetical protein